jgi:hypothetical protein
MYASTLVQLASPIRTSLPGASILGAFAPGVTVRPTAAAAETAIDGGGRARLKGPRQGHRAAWMDDRIAGHESATKQP